MFNLSNQMELTSVGVRCPLFPFIGEICFIFRNMLFFLLLDSIFFYMFITQLPFCSSQSRCKWQEEPGRKEGKQISSFYFPDTTEHLIPTLNPHGFIRRLRQAETQGKAQRRQSTAVTISAEAGLAPGQAMTAPAQEKARDCGRLLSPNLLPLTPPAPSFQARRATRCGMVFLGQGRGQEKQTKANSGVQKGRRDHAGNLFLSVCSGHRGECVCRAHSLCLSGDLLERGFRRG